jgi:hypothetical protein
MMYLHAECVLILKYYFGRKLSATVREVFSDAYPQMVVPDKTTLH